ncbi:N-acetylmuramic acid 6-phosphate etherase [Nonomuraea dietziae]|uniref:N-acetylmuramic acid 6-phosphate etherase n=1 Tax=Nonomuraea dietziae TaxID=65515 RepID=A0A7W5VBD6_9ACTN|nr:N-acetylmuramic acid 6-phosphate etherase [Nonomuraea dietziae]MBB3728494.1 N-acetylmuramic acid 6-phosphate etherase [Nonomuraea dietziae]
MLRDLVTEQQLPGLDDLDGLSTLDLVRRMGEQDALVPTAVAGQSARIAAAVDAVSARMREGGRLIYLGAGTAGRIGMLDASECGPTFGTTPEEVFALIAGGPSAFAVAVEGAEDSAALAVSDLTEVSLSAADAVVGISASGRTPYAVGGVRHARAMGAMTVGVACNEGSPLGEAAEIAIEVVVGPEFLTGSTRLKSGTAQKLVCNMISTLTMVRLGRTHGNLMTHLVASNEKLWARAHDLVSSITGLPDAEVEPALQAAEGSVPTAVIMLLTGADPDQAREALARTSGNLREALRSF